MTKKQIECLKLLGYGEVDPEANDGAILRHQLFGSWHHVEDAPAPCKLELLWSDGSFESILKNYTDFVLHCGSMELTWALAGEREKRRTKHYLNGN
jgi:uncharacterized membrane protein